MSSANTVELFLGLNIQTFRNALQQARSSLQSALGGISGLANQTSQAVQTSMSQAGTVTGQTVQSVQSAAASALQSVQQATTNAGSSTAQAMQSVQSAATSALNSVQASAASVSSAIQSSAQGAQSVQSTVASALHSAQQTSSQIGTAVSVAGHAVQASVSQVGASIHSAAVASGHAVQASATSALHSVQQASTQTGTAVQHAAHQAGQAAESMGTRFAKLAAAIGAMGFLRSSVKEFAEFDTEMLKVQALSKATGDELDALKNKAAELGASTKFAAADAASGMGQLAAAGYNTAQILEAIGPAMYAAAAGGSDLGETADQLTNIMGAFGLEADQAGRVADVLTEGFTGAATTMSQLAFAMKPAGPIARGLGYSLEETVAALQALANAGIKGEMAGTALRGNLSKLLNQTPEATKVLKQYGIQIEDNEGKVRKLSDIIRDFGKSGMGMKELNTIFGETSSYFKVLIDQGADALEEYESKLLSAKGRAKEVSDAMESGIGGALNRLSAAFSQLKNSFGEALAPAVSKIADALGALAGWFSQMPDWAKQALALAAVFATVAGSFGAAKGIIIAACTQIKTAFLALAANPWVVALTAALGLAVVAYKRFGKSALDASKEHAQAAEEIGKSVAATRKQVDELKTLQKTLLETEASTEAHRNAEEKLARVLPEANTRIDEQGRVLATLTNATDENNKKLNELIATKEREARMQMAAQIDKQARAYIEAGKALDGYKEYMRQTYGFGEKVLTYEQKVMTALDRKNGVLDKALSKGEKYSGNLERQKKSFEDLLRVMAKGEVSFSQMNEMLNRIGVDSETKGRIISEYRSIMAEVKRETNASTKESADKTKQITEEALKEMKKRWQEYAKQVRGLQDQIAGREKSLAAELREMGRSGMSDLGAWQDRKKEAEEYVEAAKKAAAEAQAAFSEGDTVTATAKWKEALAYADDAKSAYRALNQEVKDGDQVIIGKADALKTAMSGVEEAGQLGIEILQQQKQAAADAMKGIEEEAKKGGVSDVAAALTEGMDEAEKKWVEKWQNMRQAAEEAGQQVYKVWQNAAGFWTNVDDAFSAGWSKSAESFRRGTDEAYADFSNKGKSFLKEMQENADTAAKGISRSLGDAGEQISEVWKNAAGFWTNVDDQFSAGWSKVADGFRRELQDGAFADFDGKARSSAENFAQNWSISTDQTRGLVIQLADDIKRKLDEACKPRTVMIYTSEVVKRAVGGIIGSLTKSGKLPGYGGGDRISALLEAGEFIIRKEAVKHFGVGFFNALNSLKLPELSGFIPEFPVPVFAGALPTPSRTVNINLTMPSGNTYQMTTDEATASRIERERERWWSLRSSNRVKPSNFVNKR